MRRRLLAAVAGAVVLAASGCTTDKAPEPAPLPTESASPSDSGSPSPTAPTLPAAAEGTSPAAAKAFVRHWVTLLNHAAETGETAGLAAASAPRCGACTAAIESIGDVYEAGGRFRGQGWNPHSIKYQPLQPKRRPVLTVAMDIAPQTVIEADGAQPQQFDGGRRSMTFHLQSARNGSWTVRQLEQAA